MTFIQKLAFDGKIVGFMATGGGGSGGQKSCLIIQYSERSRWAEKDVEDLIKKYYS